MAANGWPMTCWPKSTRLVSALSSSAAGAWTTGNPFGGAGQAAAAVRVATGPAGRSWAVPCNAELQKTTSVRLDWPSGSDDSVCRDEVISAVPDAGQALVLKSTKIVHCVPGWRGAPTQDDPSP